MATTYPTQDEYNSLLYKKIQGAPYTNPTVSPAAEAQGTSNINVQLSQIWNQPIPTSAPTDLITTPDSYGTKSTSTSYPYISKYIVKTINVVNPNISFYYAGTNAGNVVGTNKLISGIPYNQDPVGTYNFSVGYGATSNSLINLPSGGATYPWYYDIDSGYLTFFNQLPTSYYNGTPNFLWITFWRYEGTTLATSIYWGATGTNNSDIYNTNSGNVLINQNVIMAGPTGQVYYQFSDGTKQYTAGTTAGNSVWSSTGTNNSDIANNNSGNVLINQNVIMAGPTGQVYYQFSDGTKQYSSWEYYYENAPPPVVFNNNYASNATYSYISWTYPSQKRQGTLNIYAPIINSFSSTYSVNGGSSNIPIVTGATGTNYSKYSSQIATSTYITGIVLTGNPSVPQGYQTTLTFPTETTPRNCFVYYSNTFNGLTTSTNNIITAWYSNFQEDGTNKNSIQFNILLSPGVPSAPGIPTFGNATPSGVVPTSTSGVSVTGTFATPTYSDVANSVTGPTGPPAIKQYIMDVFSTGSTVRYNGLNTPYGPSYGPTGFTGAGFVTAFPTGLTGAINLSSLYPDCIYTAHVKAQNDSSNTAYGATSGTGTFTSTYLPMPVPSGTYGPSGTAGTSYTYYDAKLVGNNNSGNSANATISNVLFTSPAPFNSTNVTHSIQSVANRGSTGTNIFTASATITRPGTSGFTGTATLSYNGFPISNPTSTQTSTLITINGTLPVDGYTTTLNNALQGFYLNTTNSTTLPSLAFTASNEKTTTTLTTTQSGDTPINNSMFFYYDSYTGAPTNGGVSILFGTLTYSEASGIFFVYNPIALQSTTIVSNIGTYFYNKNQILNYYYNASTTAFGGETGTSNVAPGGLTGPGTSPPYDELANSVIFTNSSVIIPSTTTFAKQPSFNVTSYGPTTTSTQQSATLNIIYDPPTHNLLNSTTFNPTSPQSISTTTLVYGFRILSQAPKSGQTDSYYTELPPTTFNLNVSYNNTLSLLTDAQYDIQLTNGTYQTKGTTSNGYLNYNGIIYSSTLTNTLDYSTIPASGYRYLTFTYTVPFTSVNNIKFVVQNDSSTQIYSGSTNQQPYIGSSNGSRIYFYFRGENSEKYTAQYFTADYSNSTWVDATIPTTSSNPLITSQNYYNYIGIPLLSCGATLTYSTTTFTMVCPSTMGFSNSGGGGTNYVILRIALPMNSTFKLTGVQALIAWYYQ